MRRYSVGEGLRSVGEGKREHAEADQSDINARGMRAEERRAEERHERRESVETETEGDEQLPEKIQEADASKRLHNVALELSLCLLPLLARSLFHSLTFSASPAPQFFCPPVILSMI